MVKRNTMTPDSRTASGTPGAGTGPAGSGERAGSGVPAPGRLSGRYRALSRRSRLALAAGALVIAVAVALTVIGSLTGGSRASALPRAKNFTLSVLGHPGQHVSLSQYTGKPVVLNFFASWCEPCQKETPLIAKFYRDAHGSVTIIGIDVNDPASSALKFVHAKDVEYPVAADPAPMATTISYGVSGLPQTFFLNARHQIVKRVFGAVTLREMRAGVALMRQTK